MANERGARGQETTSVPCFVCGKWLDRVSADVPTQPYGGLTFVAGGNYGSRIFDPFATSERLHIVVCDECAQAGAGRMVAVMERRTKPTFEYRRFDSFDEFKEEVIPDDD